jgi:hypothetical protein
MYSCEKDDSNIIDPILYFPVIDTAGTTPDIFDTSHIQASMKVKVTSVDPIAYVRARIIDPKGAVVQEVDLQFDGTYYTRLYDKVLDCWLVGDYRVEYTAVTTAGLSSPVVSNPFTIINPNSLKPVVTIIYAPDSLQRPTGDPVPVFLKIQTLDPNGSCDVLKAYFNSILPNGNPSSGNPFAMYDDGNVLPPYCDTVANDGKYSLLVQFPSSASLGNYQFRFNADDRSGIVSDTLTKIVTVY